MRRQYVPLSLLSLQRLVDLGRIDVMRPIDLTVLCNTRVPIVDPAKNHYGINLTDEVCIKFYSSHVLASCCGNVVQKKLLLLSFILLYNNAATEIDDK